LSTRVLIWGLLMLAGCATNSAAPKASAQHDDRLSPRALVGQYLSLRLRLTNEVPWVVICTPGWETLPEDTLVRWGPRVVAHRMTADTLCRSPIEARKDTALKVLLVRYDVEADTQRIDAIHRQAYWPIEHRETFLHLPSGDFDLRFWYFSAMH